MEQVSLSLSHFESLILRVDCHSCVSKHSLNTSGCHGDFLIRTLHGISKEDKDTKFYLFVVARDGEKGPPTQLNLVNLHRDMKMKASVSDL